MGSLTRSTSPSVTGYTSAYSPSQQALLSSLSNRAYGGLGTGAFDITQTPMYMQGSQALSSFLTPSKEDLESRYQTQFVEPSLATFRQQIIPGIEERFSEAGATRSSALNQALAAAARDLATNLSSQRAGLLSEQEARRQQAINQALQYGAAGPQTEMQLAQLGLQPYRTPIVQPGQQGLLQSLIPGMANIGAAYAAGRWF